MKATKNTQRFTRGGVMLSRQLDNAFGQLGICSRKTGENCAKPKFCSFNIPIKAISCGREHTALISSTRPMNT